MMAKFEEAYCSKTNRIVNIETVTDAFKSDEIYIKNYKDSLLCPECRKARLSFVNAEKAYFRTSQNAQHAENCSRKQLAMSSREVAKWLRDPEGIQSAIRQMESILVTLLDEASAILRIPKDVGNNMTRGVQRIPQKVGIRTKPFPRKRIDIEFSEDDFDTTKLFYGIIRFKWEKEENKAGYKALLYHPIKKYLLCKLYVSENVYTHLPIELKQNFGNDFKCAVAFFAEFHRDGKSKYLATFLRHSQHFKYIILSDGSTLN